MSKYVFYFALPMCKLKCLAKYLEIPAIKRDKPFSAYC